MSETTTSTTTGDPLLTHLPPEFQRAVQTKLQPGERVLWAQRPMMDRFRAPNAGFAGVLAYVFSAAAVLMVILLVAGPRGMNSGGLTFMALLFAAAGALFFYVPTMWRTRLLRTVYVVTSSRAMAVVLSTPAQVFPPANLANMLVRENPDGSGDLVLGQSAITIEGSTSTTDLGFFAIPNVREVEALIRGALVSR